MERPAIVSACGILNIVLAAGRLINLLLYIPLRAHVLTYKSTVLRRIHENASYAFWFEWRVPLTFVGFVLLLVTGLGLLRLKEWARKLAIAYGILAILVDTGRAASYFAVEFGPLLETSAHSLGVQRYAPMVATFGALSPLIYPILLIAFMTRPRIAAAFRLSIHPPPLPGK